jgi:hypothetical protein
VLFAACFGMKDHYDVNKAQVASILIETFFNLAGFAPILWQGVHIQQLVDNAETEVKHKREFLRKVCHVLIAINFFLTDFKELRTPFASITGYIHWINY